MIVEHDGVHIPTLTASWDPSDIDHVFLDWSTLAGDASVVSATWTLPTGWAILAQYDGVTVEADGESYANAYGVMLSSAGREGRYSVSCLVDLDDGRRYERSFLVYVRDI